MRLSLLVLSLVAVTSPLFTLVPARAQTSPLYQFEWKLGGEAQGIPQFQSPRSVSVDSRGNIYVADEYNDRVVKLNASGQFVAQVGIRGSENGQLNQPAGVVTDGQDNLYVTDKLNHRVQKFSAEGQYLLQFGTEGTGNGQFKSPRGLAIDRQGNLYVADRENFRIQKFDGSGQYLMQFGGPGSTDGNFRNMEGVAVDDQGNIYVTDSGLNTVQKFDAQGRFLLKFGTYGSNDGQFHAPGGIKVDSQGLVYVSDNNPRVQTFTGSGQFVAKFGSYGKADGQFMEPTGLALDAQGNIYVTETTNRRIQKFNGSGQFQWKAGEGSLDGQLHHPEGVALDRAGNIYVMDALNFRVQKFSASRQFMMKFGSHGSGFGRFTNGAGIAVSGSGTIYVADEGGTIQRFSPEGRYETIITGTDANMEGFRSPTCVLADVYGYVYGLSSGVHRFKKLNYSGQVLIQFGTFGYAKEELHSPYGMAFDAQGNIYITDRYYNYHSLKKFNINGQFQWSVGAEVYGGSSADGSFRNPSGVAVDGSGNILVADQGNHRIQVFNANGQYVGKFGTYGAGDGQFNEPTWLAVDAAGNVYVSDKKNNRIQMFSKVAQPPPPPPPLVPEIAVKEEYGYIIPDNIGSFSFGTAQVGTSSAKTFTIDNSTGTGTLSLSNLVLPAGFSLQSSFPATVPAGGSATFTVALNTSVAGDYRGVLSFATNDADENPYNFTIAGTVNKRHQNILFYTLPDKTYGDPAFTLSATVYSGLPITYSVVAGPATVSGNTVTLTGTGVVTIRAAQVGDDVYVPAAMDQTFTVHKGAQRITFGSISEKTYGDAPFTLSASSNTGLPVTLSVTYGPATISGSTVAVTGTGMVYVMASQPGNANYLPASVTRSFLVKRAAPTIQWSIPGSITHGTPLTNETLNATATFNGSAVNGSFVYAPAPGAVLPAGTHTLTVAFTPAEAHYEAATASVTLQVLKADQTVDFGPLEDQQYGAAPYALSATASSGLPVHFTVIDGPATLAGNQITLTGTGAVTVRAEQPGDANTNAAMVDQRFTVRKRSQTITFSPVADRTPGAATFTPHATASSGLPVHFSIVSGPARLSGNVVSLTGTGPVVIRATQDGDAQYDAAPAVESNFCVLPAKPQVTAQGAELVSSSETGNQWYLNGNMLAGATQQKLHAATEGNYAVAVTGPCGSPAISDAFLVTVASVENDKLASGTRLYPNPATTRLVLELPAGLSYTSVQVFDNKGVSVTPPLVREGNRVVFPVVSLRKGFYVLQVRAAGGIIYKKFIVQ